MEIGEAQPDLDPRKKKNGQATKICNFHEARCFHLGHPPPTVKNVSHLS